MNRSEERNRSLPSECPSIDTLLAFYRLLIATCFTLTARTTQGATVGRWSETLTTRSGVRQSDCGVRQSDCGVRSDCGAR